MAATLQDATEIMIEVPKAYRNYIVRAENKSLLLLLFASAVLDYVWCIRWKHSWVPGVPENILLGAGLFYWLYQQRKPWHYKINSQCITLPNLNGSGGWRRLWKEVSWNDDIAEAVEWQWGDLPGILFVMKDDDNLLLVYLSEDTEAVRQHVLPLVERFILPERQEYWAEQWRTS